MKKEKNTKEPCAACGTSPVNHELVFSLKLIEDIIGKIGDFFNVFYFVARSERITNFFEKIFINLAHIFGIIRYNNDIEKTIIGRSKVIWEEARRRGIEMEQIFVFGKPVDHFRAKINGKNIFFESIPVPPSLPKRGYVWVDNKFILAKKLREAGIAAPLSEEVYTLKGAISAFEKLSKPVILKPKSGSRGRHTTTNINTKEEMKKAFKLARQITFSMIIQEHLSGSVYRATTVNNKLVGFYRADYPCVKGDGKKTIKELIEEKNKNRPNRVSEILINEELLNFIKRQSYKIDDILPDGFQLNLIAKTGRLYGSYTKEILPEVHSKFFSIMERASKITSIPVAGFDLIIPDPTLDPDTQKWGIIECNSLPFIDLHYFALEGEPVNIASYIWDLWDIKK